MSYELTPLDHENDFVRKWAGWGAHNNRWSWGDSGTQKIFNDEDKAEKMLKGEYILKAKPTWMKNSYEYPVLQRLKMGLTSPHPV